jgi:hypothetical protein
MLQIKHLTEGSLADNGLSVLKINSTKLARSGKRLGINVGARQPRFRCLRCSIYRMTALLVKLSWNLPLSAVPCVEQVLYPQVTRLVSALR